MKLLFYEKGTRRIRVVQKKLIHLPLFIFNFYLVYLLGLEKVWERETAELFGVRNIFYFWESFHLFLLKKSNAMKL